MRKIARQALGLAALLGASSATGQTVFIDGFEPDGVPQGAPLNDSGMQLCSGSGLGAPAACSGVHPLAQDAQLGRDALAMAGQLPKIGAGNGGFDFSKLSNAGNPLPANAALGSAPAAWACTRDNRTGLIWEVKVNNPDHLRHFEHRYTWYFPASPDGNPGSEGPSLFCGPPGTQRCNTQVFTQAVNAVTLCGASNWRLPTVKELEGISDFGRLDPAIDSTYFPNTYTPNPNFISAFYWSATASVQDVGRSWSVFVSNGEAISSSRVASNAVRLVRTPP